MKVWLRQHRAALANALAHVRRAKGSFSLNVLVTAIALGLPFAGLTLVQNLQPITRTLAVEASIGWMSRAPNPLQAFRGPSDRIADDCLGGRFPQSLRP